MKEEINYGRGSHETQKSGDVIKREDNEWQGEVLERQFCSWPGEKPGQTGTRTRKGAGKTKTKKVQEGKKKKSKAGIHTLPQFLLKPHGLSLQLS